MTALKLRPDCVRIHAEYLNYFQERAVRDIFCGYDPAAVGIKIESRHSISLPYKMRAVCAGKTSGLAVFSSEQSGGQPVRNVEEITFCGLRGACGTRYYGRTRRRRHTPCVRQILRRRKLCRVFLQSENNQAGITSPPVYGTKFAWVSGADCFQCQSLSGIYDNPRMAVSKS